MPLEDVKFWMPAEMPSYLSIRRNNETGRPETEEEFLMDQARLLEMIVAESNDKEIEFANQQIQDHILDWVNLPNNLLFNKRTPWSLFLTLGVHPYSPMGEWRQGIEEALATPDATPEELQEELRGMSLESFLSRIL